jgi:hypothetical protein
MPRFLILALVALGIAVTGCETGSTHVNMPDQGATSQNVGQGTDKSGPVPGSSTGTDTTASTPPVEAAPAAPAATPAAHK